MSAENVEKVMEAEAYNGSLELEFDKKRNTGGEWYAARNNAKRYHRDVIRSVTPELKHFIKGRGIAAKKFHTVPEDDLPRFRYENFSDFVHIGKGSYGTVFKARLGKEGFVALKQSSTRNHSEVHWKERDINILLKHPRICNMIGAFHDVDMFFVFELCLGTLRVQEARLNIKQKVRFAIQMAEGLQWIHENNILHCDLRPDNVLITSNNNAVIADFSNALILKNGYSSVKSDRQLGVCGYQDFEATDQWNYSKENDVFSLGCILFQMDSGKYLLNYSPHNGDVPREEYAVVFKYGRIRDMLVYPITSQVRRESLEDRIVRLTTLFGSDLRRFVLPRRNRITLEEFLGSDFLGDLRKAVDFEHLDNDLDNILSEVKGEDKFEPFRSLNQSDASSGENMAYDLIYYDEREDPAVRKAPKTVGSYDTAVIVRHLVEHGGIGRLTDAIAKNDPVALGEVHSIVEGWLGRPHVKNPKDLYQDQQIAGDGQSAGGVADEQSDDSQQINQDHAANSPEMSVGSPGVDGAEKLDEKDKNDVQKSPEIVEIAESEDEDDNDEEKSEKQQSPENVGNTKIESPPLFKAPAPPKTKPTFVVPTGNPGVEGVLADILSKKKPTPLKQAILKQSSPPIKPTVGAAPSNLTIRAGAPPNVGKPKLTFGLPVIPKKKDKSSKTATSDSGKTDTVSLVPTIKKLASGKYEKMSPPPKTEKKVKPQTSSKEPKDKRNADDQKDKGDLEKKSKKGSKTKDPRKSSEPVKTPEKERDPKPSSSKKAKEELARAENQANKRKLGETKEDLPKPKKKCKTPITPETLYSDDSDEDEDPYACRYCRAELKGLKTAQKHMFHCKQNPKNK